MSETPSEGESTPTKEEANTVAETGTDWKAEARKWEDRAKANKTAADKLTEIENAAKTETERLADQLAAAQTRVTEFEQRDQLATWKADVEEATGVPAAALAGASLAELQAHAETLKPLITPRDEKKGALAPYVPSEGTASGGTLGGTAQLFADAMNSALN